MQCQGQEVHRVSGARQNQTDNRVRRPVTEGVGDDEHNERQDNQRRHAADTRRRRGGSAEQSGRAGRAQAADAAARGRMVVLSVSGPCTLCCLHVRPQRMCPVCAVAPAVSHVSRAHSAQDQPLLINCFVTFFAASVRAASLSVDFHLLSA